MNKKIESMYICDEKKKEVEELITNCRKAVEYDPNASEYEEAIVDFWDWLNGLKEKPIISKITEILYNRKGASFCLSDKAIAWLGERSIAYKGIKQFNPLRECRHDPLLIECFKTLGQEATDSLYCELDIYRTSSDCYMIVNAKDGSEIVVTLDDSKWITI